MGCANSTARQAGGAPPTAGLAVQRRQKQQRARRLSTDEEVLRRADEKKLPKHLRLGITVQGLKELVDSSPPDAVDQCNAAIPKAEDGTPLYPPNNCLNGYVNQHVIKKGDSATSVCERLQRQGSPHVGVAKIFVSWYLKTPMHTLVDALEQYLSQHPDVPRDTKFWVRLCRRSNAATRAAAAAVVAATCVLS